MLRRLPLLGLWCVTFVATAGVLVRPPAPLLVVSIDGLHPRQVLEAEQNGLRIPELRRLLRLGGHATAVTSVLPPLTYPAHATLVTGVAPARHGILANRPFRPGRGEGESWYWYAEDIRVPTLWDAAREAGLSSAAVDWPVTVGARLTWNVAQFWARDDRDDSRLRRALATPGLIEELESTLGPYPSGYAYGVEEDRRRTGCSAHILRTRRPRLHLAYLSGLDEVQHRQGPESAAARDALEAIDAMVGELRRAAEEAGGGAAHVAIVSDHGFATTTRELDLPEALRRAGLAPPARCAATGCASAWTAGGTAAVMLEKGSDPETPARLARALEDLARDPESGIDRILTGVEAARAGGFPQAALLVAMRPGYRLGDRADGVLLRSGPPEGTHGYLPEDPSMDAVFLIAGPTVAAGLELGRIDMRDVAPTLAGVLGIELPAAEGQDRLRSPGVMAHLTQRRQREARPRRAD
jgi:predicted AlkP superfamily pyrophosphatase or phosphodiesterase